MIDTHRPGELYEEVAFIAYYFNWSHDEILALPHWERRRWCDEISQINQKLNAGDPEGIRRPMEPTLDNLPL